MDTLYARLLGSSWVKIAAPIRSVHTADTIVRARGRLQIEHGRHPLARLLARLLRLPRPTDAAETRLVVTPHADGELWQRTFGGRGLETRQYQAGERDLAERFGVIEFRFHLEASNGSLVYHQTEAAVLFGSIRLRFPANWAPKVEAREDPAGAHHVHVSVRVNLPAAGPLLAYEGTIEIEEPAA